MAKQKGEMTAREAAVELDVPEDTVRRWARESIYGRQSYFENVRVDLSGRYYIPRKQVERLKSLTPREILEMRE